MYVGRTREGGETVNEEKVQRHMVGMLNKY